MYPYQNIVDEATMIEAQRSFMNKVYAWMVAGLLITAATAWFVVESELYYDIISGGMFSFLIILQLLLVIGLSFLIDKMSTTIAAFCFLAYSFVSGITFSTVFVAYTSESIQSVFLISAAMFASMSIYGSLTKRNLSRMGSFMFMGLIGIIFASIINFFMASSAIHFAISVIGVAVFAGLTAYDTQKLKDMAIMNIQNDQIIGKSAILGALTLYLDFINLFLMLLRLLGDRR